MTQRVLGKRSHREPRRSRVRLHSLLCAPSWFCDLKRGGRSPIEHKPRRHPQQMSFLSAIPAFVKSKAATGIAAATLAVAGAGVVTATAATGSPNPSDWGKAVTAAVATCKDNLQPGGHGIGACVSAVADQRGKNQSGQHRAPQSNSHPAGKPTNRPTSQP
jgi:hypothetical protein